MIKAKPFRRVTAQPCWSKATLPKSVPLMKFTVHQSMRLWLTLLEQSTVFLVNKTLFSGGQVPWTGPAPTAGLMFRPEDLKLAAPGGGNFSAQVVTAFFLGDHVRLVLDAGAPDLFIARVFERHNFVKGETVEFTLSPHTMVSLEN